MIIDALDATSFSNNVSKTYKLREIYKTCSSSTILSFIIKQGTDYGPNGVAAAIRHSQG